MDGNYVDFSITSHQTMHFVIVFYQRNLLNISFTLILIVYEWPGSVRNVKGIVIVNTNFTVHCMQSLTII